MNTTITIQQLTGFALDINNEWQGFTASVICNELVIINDNRDLVCKLLSTCEIVKGPAVDDMTLNMLNYWLSK